MAGQIAVLRCIVILQLRICDNLLACKGPADSYKNHCCLWGLIKLVLTNNPDSSLTDEVQ
jgi:hypothetical protein